MIDWLVHSQSLIHLSPNQRKTITQMIHELLPVNAPPGIASHPPAKICPMWKLELETQENFLQCHIYDTSWDTIITEVLQD
jgi:hypothetical protein